MKSIRVILAVLVLAVVAAAGLGGYVLSRGLSARDEPSGAEAFIARRLRRMAMPGRSRELKNPVQAGPEVLSGATAHFADHCASCHGNDGRGETIFGQGLYPKPPDLRREDTQKLSDGEMFWIIENGVRFTGMPAFGGEIGSQEDSWKLVRFIRHLPRLTEEERMEMERYNPKGPEDLEEEQEENNFLQGAPIQQKPEEMHHH